MEKKIIIQSESTDRSTDDVVAWLNYFNQLDSIVTFFDDYPITQFSLDYSDTELLVNINGNTFSTSDSYWYRRGVFCLNKYLKSKIKGINQYLSNTQLRSISSILDAPLCRCQLNCYRDNYIEKLQMLNDARKVGLMIPPTLYTDSLDKVRAFIHQHTSIITKTTIVPFGTVVLDKTYRFASGTVKFGIDDLNGMPNHFLPSIFQKYMEKKYEIRTFYLNGMFYSMAIFSQLNKATQVDCRKETEVSPREVPYKLPAEYEKKLSHLMDIYSLNSCSIDTIVTPDNEFYFLEINPVGQFQWLSKKCNHQIEKKIAQYLIQEL